MHVFYFFCSIYVYCIFVFILNIYTYFYYYICLLYANNTRKQINKCAQVKGINKQNGVGNPPNSKQQIHLPLPLDSLNVE